MACACMDVSSVESRRQNVSETPTSTRLTVSSDWKRTTVAISRRWMELRRLSLKHVTFAATDERLSAGQQFAEIERFSQIIICSSVKQGYDGLLVVPGG